MDDNQSFTAFAGQRRLATGAFEQVAAEVRQHLAQQPDSELFIFDDASGRQLELAHHPDQPSGPVAPEPTRARTSTREVALFARHWEWLEEEPGGASAALRRLVELASKTGQGERRARRAREAAAQFMWTMTGNLPGFEEASRALYAKDQTRLERLIAGWPSDLREHVRSLSREAARLDASLAT